MKHIKEINEKNYRRFEDMIGLVNAMRRNVKVWTWGVHGWRNVNNTFLQFRVSGHLFKGFVILGVNGMDLFDIFLASTDGTIKEEINDVFIDELIDTIDVKVEKIPNYKW